MILYKTKYYSNSLPLYQKLFFGGNFARRARESAQDKMIQYLKKRIKNTESVAEKEDLLKRLAKYDKDTALKVFYEKGNNEFYENIWVNHNKTNLERFNRTLKRLKEEPSKKDEKLLEKIVKGIKEGDKDTQIVNPLVDNDKFSTEMRKYGGEDFIRKNLPAGAFMKDHPAIAGLNLDKDVLSVISSEVRNPEVVLHEHQHIKDSRTKLYDPVEYSKAMYYTGPFTVNEATGEKLGNAAFYTNAENILNYKRNVVRPEGNANSEAVKKSYLLGATKKQLRKYNDRLRLSQSTYDSYL